jgi:membrane fusion protein (multidrug efflux system)
MKFSKSIQASCIIAISASIGMTSCKQQTQQMQMGAPQIATLTVNYASSELEKSYPATIKGRTDIDIRPQVTGFITKVHVDEGQRVHKGQILFTLDQVQYQAAVESAQAAVLQAETALSTAKLTEGNKRKLLEKNIISEYEWQMADNNLRQAQAQLSAAKAQLVSAKKNLAYTEVTSPCDGVVGTIPNREGSLASPSSAVALTTVSDNSQVYAYFSLTERDLLDMTSNGSATLEQRIAAMPMVKLRLSDGTVYPLEGKVATVSGVIDNSTGSASVRALFNNSNGMLRSGSTGQIIVPQAQDSVIIIPQSATFEVQDRRFVYVVNDSNKVVSTPITIGELNDGKTFVVTSGLTAGNRIAIEGIGTKLSDGLEITPVDAAAAQEQQQQQAAH